MSQCMTPYSVKNKLNGTYADVPCGRCPACVSRRTSAWSFRLMQESKRHEHSSFITLTYDTNHILLSSNSFPSLFKRHIQLFFKKLRKRLSRYDFLPCKYYTVGEYGGRTKRPHYHAIIFGVDSKLIMSAQSYNLLQHTQFDGKHQINLLDWQHGLCTVGTVSEASVGYCLKYISKGSWRPMHANDDRQPPFALMSKGLGENYLTGKMLAWHLSPTVIDARMYCNIEGGKKISMPRYYKDKIYSDIQRKKIAYFARLNAVEKNPDITTPIYHQLGFDCIRQAQRNMNIHALKFEIL
ncbi:MAG: replication initiator protein [Microvirus sp.]|nr:MAG: replication initiator protein [Microvirus sp.]